VRACSRWADQTTKSVRGFRPSHLAKTKISSCRLIVSSYATVITACQIQGGNVIKNVLSPPTLQSFAFLCRGGDAAKALFTEFCSVLLRHICHQSSDYHQCCHQQVALCANCVNSRKHAQTQNIKNIKFIKGSKHISKIITN
jgi:hypothetical protein